MCISYQGFCMSQQWSQSRPKCSLKWATTYTESTLAQHFYITRQIYHIFWAFPAFWTYLDDVDYDISDVGPALAGYCANIRDAGTAFRRRWVEFRPARCDSRAATDLWSVTPTKWMPPIPGRWHGRSEVSPEFAGNSYISQFRSPCRKFAAFRWCWL